MLFAIFDLLALFELSHWGDELIESYSHGMKQRLVMSAALLHDPEVIIVDEPMVGLDPMAIKMVKELFKSIVAMNEQGITILLVEQNIRNALEIADRAYLLENGRITMEGAPDQFLENDHVKKAYLGL